MTDQTKRPKADTSPPSEVVRERQAGVPLGHPALSPPAQRRPKVSEVMLGNLKVIWNHQTQTGRYVNGLRATVEHEEMARQIVHAKPMGRAE